MTTDRDARQYGRYEAAKTPQQQREEFAEALVRYSDDPYAFAMWAFPWGVPGTTLEHETGPDKWQREELEAIGEHIRECRRTKVYRPYRGATASGHGIGKSAQTSIIIVWAEVTSVDTRGVVTANSDTQLRTKTWAELAKWWDLFCSEHPIAKEIFELTATGIRCREREMTWRIDAIPNNPRNPAAFAGAHNAGKRLLVIVDEASEIEDPIWDTVEGAMTDADTEIIYLIYGNPTKNIGRFKEMVVGRLRHQWRSRQIDSRNVKRTNKAELQAMVDAWGEDSDFVRVRVRGVFPRVGSMQLIPSDLVAEARKRVPVRVPSAPLVAGLDVARFGDDASVLQARQGLDAQTIPMKTWREVDTMTLAGDVAAWCLEYKPDALFVDIGGIGAGVYDRLQQLGIPNVMPVNFGGKGGRVQMNAIEADAANKSASMWVGMREWLRTGGCIADDNELEQDLTGREYGYTANGAIMLEKKEAMKKRGLSSPDKGDALALTFAFPVAPKQVAASLADLMAVQAGGGQHDPYSPVQTDYDPYAELNR